MRVNIMHVISTNRRIYQHIKKSNQLSSYLCNNIRKNNSPRELSQVTRRSFSIIPREPHFQKFLHSFKKVGILINHCGDRFGHELTSANTSTHNTHHGRAVTEASRRLDWVTRAISCRYTIRLGIQYIHTHTHMQKQWGSMSSLPDVQSAFVYER